MLITDLTGLTTPRIITAITGELTVTEVFINSVPMIFIRLEITMA